MTVKNKGPWDDVPDPPFCVRESQARFKPRSWETYTFEELFWWVRLLCKRAGNRAVAAEAYKDVRDAQNYLSMAQAKLSHLKGWPGTLSIDDRLDVQTGEICVASMLDVLSQGTQP